MSGIEQIFQGVAIAAVYALAFIAASYLGSWANKDMREIRRRNKNRKHLLLKGDTVALAKMNRPWLWEEPLLSSVYADHLRDEAYSTATHQIIDFWDHRTRWVRRFRKITHTRPAV